VHQDTQTDGTTRTTTDAEQKAQTTQTDSDVSEAMFAQTLRASVDKTLDEFKEQNWVLEFLEFKGKVQGQNNAAIRSWLCHESDRSQRKADVIGCNLQEALKVATAHADAKLEATIHKMEALRNHARHQQGNEMEQLMNLHGAMNAALLTKRQTLVFVGKCSHSAGLCDVNRMKKANNGEGEALWSYSCFGHAVQQDTAFAIMEQLKQGKVPHRLDDSEDNQRAGPLKDDQNQHYKINGQYIQLGSALRDNANKPCKVWNPATATELVARYDSGAKRRIPLSDLTLEKNHEDLDDSLLGFEHDAQLRKVEHVSANYVLRLDMSPMKNQAAAHGRTMGLSIFSATSPQKIVDANYLLQGYSSAEIDVATLFAIARKLDISDVLLLGIQGDPPKVNRCSTCGQACTAETKFCSGCGENLGGDAGAHSCKNFDLCKLYAENFVLPAQLLSGIADSIRETDFWAPMQELTNLTSLTIGKSNGIGAKACKYLMKLVSLTSLHIGDANDIGSQGCMDLSELKSLTSLDIGRNNIGTEGCKYLKELHQLTSLSIGKENHVKEEGCGHLTGLQQLKSLSIWGYNDLNAEACEHFMELEHLSSLHIGKRNNIGAEGCEHLTELKQLENLKLGGFNNIGALGCEHLKKLKPTGGLVGGRLRRLRIGGHNNIQSEGKEHLRELEPCTCVSIRAKGNFKPRNLRNSITQGFDTIVSDDYGGYERDHEDDDGDDDADVEPDEIGEEEESKEDLWSSEEEDD